MLDTLLIVSIGELGTHVLEAVSRSNIFRRIVVGSRSIHKARKRVNNALLGAGVEGHFPVLEYVEFDLNEPACIELLKRLDPDVVFSAPSLRPWWKISEPDSGAIPFGGTISLQLAPMAALRQRMMEAQITGLWIGASYPDVINPALCSSGIGPELGIGNVSEPVAKIQSGIATKLKIDPGSVLVRLVAQHAFEYYVMRDLPPQELPPYMLEVIVDGTDVTDLGHQVLRQSFPFPYDLHFNRVTASAGLMALKALASETPTTLHLPGILGLPGGYPVVIKDRKIELDLAPGWRLEQAVAVNTESMTWEGIAGIDDDGTVRFTQKTRDALGRLTGQDMQSVHPENAAQQAAEILAALDRR